MALDQESSLRSEKKRRTRALILENAIALFRRSGIRSTRTLEIARASHVSPATLFNYFSTKQELVEAWVRGEIAALLDDIVATRPDRAIRPRLRSLCAPLAASSCEEPALRLEAWRSTARAHPPDSRVALSLERLIRGEQERGRLRSDLPASALASALLESIEGGLIAGLRASHRPVEVAATLRARVDLVLDGARKRNERVTPPHRAQNSR